MPSTATAKQWDDARSAFGASIMVDTMLSSLAQNLDGPDWPIKGAGETPAAYIDLGFDEVKALLEMKGQPPERLDQLITILTETLAFDDPFGEMVTQTAAAAEKDNPILKNLARLGIPESFPIELSGLPTDTIEFCRMEKLDSLAEFAVFAQGMAQNVIVGGDFRALLNALSHVDEAAIAKFLPFRPGVKGLHLVEAVALALRDFPETVWAVCANKPADAPPALLERTARLVNYFAAEKAVLETQLAVDPDLRRLVRSLNEPKREAAVVGLLSKHLQLVPTARPAKSGGWWSRLLGR